MTSEETAMTVISKYELSNIYFCESLINIVFLFNTCMHLHSLNTDINNFAEKSSQDGEDDLFCLPPAKHEPHIINSSDEEREEQWMKRSSTREAVYGSAMMVKGLTSIELTVFKNKTKKTCCNKNICNRCDSNRYNFACNNTNKNYFIN